MLEACGLVKNNCFQTVSVLIIIKVVSVLKTYLNLFYIYEQY